MGSVGPTNTPPCTICGEGSTCHHQRSEDQPSAKRNVMDYYDNPHPAIDGSRLSPANAHPQVRKFDTGATRDLADDKLDYEGFLSPAVLQRFAEYMHQHRFQKDGTVRHSDNWQKGIPLDAYMKSMFRHFMEVWALHRGVDPVRPEEGEDWEPDMEEALCGLLFNVQGYLHELLKED